MKKHIAGVVLFALSSLAFAQTVNQNANQAAGESYFEFGTVVAVGKRDVEVQSFDPSRGRTVQKSYTFTKDTRADVVRPGDTVEVIYSPGSLDDSGQWIVRRLIMVSGPVPKPGPVGSASTASARPVAPAGGGLPPAVVPGKKTVGLGKGAGTSAGTKAASAPSLGKTGSKTAPGVAAVNTPAQAEAGNAPKTSAVMLGGLPPARVPGVASVNMGVSAEVANGVAPKVKGIAQQAPQEGCNKSDPDWPREPIKLAVLDFRYPTDREEAHNVGSTGGGSGTAVADLIYDSLADVPDFALMRGDRQKLFRQDFAGAARIGRELGADAVLLGTFNPVQGPVTDPDFPPPVEGYSLRAGVVDTCTGQLLYRLTSISCATAVVGQEGDARTCPGSEVSLKVAPDPILNKGAYVQPIATLLAPLEGRVKPDLSQQSIGTVTTVSGSNGITVSIRVKGGVRAGETVGIHASRLAKNPTTYTLHKYQDEEIGRVKLTGGSGGNFSGTFAGDVPPRAGDSVELITE